MPWIRRGKCGNTGTRSGGEKILGRLHASNAITELEAGAAASNDVMGRAGTPSSAVGAALWEIVPKSSMKLT